MTTAATETALDRFVRQTRELFARESDPEVRWTSMSPILAELLADPAVIEASKEWPECKIVEKRATNLLFYEDPDFKFVVNGLVVAPEGYGNTENRIHDHAHIYTLYGILAGDQRIERYKRVDDGSKPDYCEIEPTFNSVCVPGEIDLVRPFEIHAEQTVGDRAVAVIVRSAKSGGFLQGRYVPAENRYWQGYGPHQVPTEMIPAKPAAAAG